MAKMTREEHIRMQRRRGRQFTGLVVILLGVGRYQHDLVGREGRGSPD